ncbi:MAG: tetrahydromethanopterin S-methyltransferase subunit G [Methanotrichaceae archaeon]|jgi:tetrahydromethanopterin S-methyltransferase subunit G
MANEGKLAVPVAVVDPVQFSELMARMDKIEEKLEFYSAEKFMRAGKSIGRDMGAAYGVCAGLILILSYIIFNYAHNWTPVLK